MSFGLFLLFFLYTKELQEKEREEKETADRLLIGKREAPGIHPSVVSRLLIIPWIGC